MSRNFLAGDHDILPGGEVPILKAQLRQQASGLTGPLLIEVKQVTHHYVEGPVVADDVVHGKDQQLARGSQQQQAGPHQRPPSQIKALPGHLSGPLPGARLWIGLSPQVHLLDLQTQPGVDLLAWPAFHLNKNRAQDLVAVDQVLESSFKALPVHLSGEQVGENHVVGCRVRGQSVQDPGTPLGVGDLVMHLIGKAFDGRSNRRTVGQQLGDLADGGAVEKILEAHVHSKGLVDPGDEGDGMKRVPAQFEQGTLHSHLCQSKDLAPDPRQLLFHHIAGRRVGDALVH